MATAIGSYATATALKALIGITDTDDDTLLGLICDRVNQVVETLTGRVIAPIGSTTYLYDGNGTDSLHLPLPVDKAPIGGITALSLVEVAPYTGASFETVASTDYFLRYRLSMTGPFQRLVFSDRPAGGYRVWPLGYSTVRLTGTAGWLAIPDDITELALNVAHRAWNARQAGQQNVTGTDEQGRPYVSRYLDGRDKDVLRRYALEMVLS